MKALSMLWMMLMVASAETAVTGVALDQNLGAKLPLQAIFRDDDRGTEKPLADYFQSGRPAILVMGYFGCPQLCSVVMNGLVESLTQIKPRASRDFDVFFISIDPAETPGLAAAKKARYVRLYGREETADAWHFLTGSAESITEITRATGFHYRHDAATNQFAHASGVLIVTPGGTISRYFYGIECPPAELVSALNTARDGKQGNRVTELLLLCYHYNPLHGRYGMLIWRTLQVGAMVTITALAWFILRNLRGGKEVAG